METTITNGQITFTAESLGAEPWALGFAGEKVSYIWRPPAGGSGGTPLCFPLLGGVPGGRYHLDGREYSMGMHGFAQHCEFRIARKDETSLLYEISETPETLAQYPYRFRFQVLYALEGTTLKTEYRVFNDDRRELYFSVGGHPRFSCPMGGAEGGSFSDYFLEFERPEPLENIVKSYGPLEVIGEYLEGGGKSIRLDYRMFEKGCFCYKAGKDRQVTLGSRTGRRKLRMRILGEAYFQVWTAVDQPFVALEPWYGSITRLPNDPPVDGDWKGRPGTLCIAPGGEYHCTHDVTI